MVLNTSRLKKHFAVVTASFVTTALAFTAVFVPGNYDAEAKVTNESGTLTEEELSAPITVSDPTNRVEFTIEQIQDGLDNNISKCLITKENGFEVVESNTRDGVLCLGDTATYKIKYTVQPSSTPTQVRMQIPTIIQNLEGEGLKNSNGSPLEDESLKDLENFARGGAGFKHSGTKSGKVMTLNFPASSATETVDTGNYTISTSGTWPNTIGQLLNLRIDFLNSQNAIQKSSETFANPIRVVGTTAWDPKLKTINSSPRYARVDGKIFYEYDVALQIPSSSVNGTNLGVVNGVWNHINQAAKVTIQTSQLPEGSKVLAANEYTTIDEDNNVIYNNSSIDSRNSVRSENYKTFTVQIPRDESNVNVANEWNVNISDYESKIVPWQYPNMSLDDTTEGFMGQKDFEPGSGEDKNVNSLKTLSNGITIGSRGTDYPNNNYAKMTTVANPSPTWNSNLWNNDNGKIGTVDLNKTNHTQFIADGIGFWNEIGASPYDGTLNNSVYCSTWDTNAQIIDTSRETRAEQRNDEGEWTNSNATILYGVDKSSNKFNNSKRTDLNASSLIAKCNDDSIEWSESPQENTNIVKAVFNDDKDAMVLGTGLVQRLLIPMKVASPESLKEIGGFPGSVQAWTLSIAGKDGTLDSSSMNSKYLFVSPNSLNPQINPISGNYTQTAGTRIDLSGMVGYGYLIKRMQKDFEEFDTYPEIEYEIDSAYKSIEISDLAKSKYDVKITEADFGPDKIPGTSDDVSPWKINIKSKSSVRITNNSSTQALTETSNWIFGTLPNHIKSGTVLNTKATFKTNDTWKKFYDDESNNVGNTKITVLPSNKIAQEEYVVDKNIYAGEKLEWNLVLSNSTSEAVSNAVTYGILPYNGDSNKTKLEQQLKNVEFEIPEGGDNVNIEVTDSPAATITEDKLSQGLIDFVPLSQQNTLEGEITAYKISVSSIATDSKKVIKVSAETSLEEKNTVVYSNMLTGSYNSGESVIESTLPVATNLLTGTIAGNVFFDKNNNKVLDDNESTRYYGMTVELLNGQDEVVDMVVLSKENDGRYEFNSLRPGNYKVRLADRGNINEKMELTTPSEYSIVLNNSQSIHENLNFGYYMESETDLSIVKSIRGYSDDEEIEDGTKVVFEAVITNNGDNRVNNIAVKDDFAGEYTCPQTSLAVGGSMTCSVETTYRATYPDNADKPVDGDDLFDEEANVPDNSTYDTGRDIVHPVIIKSGYEEGATNYYTGALICPGVKGLCTKGGTQQVKDLAFTKDGKLIAGWGEWNWNLDSFGSLDGRPSIVEYDTEDETWEHKIYAGSESIDKIDRNVNGDLYVSTTDPSDRGSNISGYMTNESGKWVKVAAPDKNNMEHVFGVYKASDGTTFVAGSQSANGDGSAVWRLKPGKSEWELMFRQPGAMSRNYWITGDKYGYVYFNQHYSADSTKNGIYRIKVDGAPGSEVRISTKATNSNSNASGFVFNDAVIFNLNTWETSRWMPTPKDQACIDELMGQEEFCGAVPAIDAYVTSDGQRMYILTSTNEIMYLNKGASKWLKANVDLQGRTYRSIAVNDEGNIYLGGDSGIIREFKITE